ncbi:unnamed protein product, partial [Symbiodinium microadriaticum]
FGGRSMGILEATDGDYLNGKFVNFATSYAGNSTQGQSDRIIRDAAGGEGTSTVYVLADRLQAERGKAAPATPYKAAPKVLGLPGSSATEASTLEMDEDVVEGLDFASQFSPPFGTERQYLDLEVAAPAEEVLEHPAPAHVEEESGQPASPTAGVEAEGSDSRGLKAAKSAARFRGAIRCGKECGKDETVGPSNDTAGTASRTCPSSADLTSTTSRSCSGASGAPRSFSAIPAYVDYAVSGSSGAPDSDGISASCGTPDADGAKAGSHDGQVDSSGNAGSHRSTEAGSHRGAEDGSHRGASSGSYDLRRHRHLLRPRCRYLLHGATACYNYGAQTLDIDDPCGTARGTKRDAIDGYGN